MKRKLYKIGASVLARTSLATGKGNEQAVLTSWEAVIPKSLLAQFNTHRVFSRNTSSSRAIPTRRIIRDFLNVTPAGWRLNAAGMQPRDVPGKAREAYFKFVWWFGKQMAKLTARLLLLGDNFPWLIKMLGEEKAYYIRGAHKEIANRVIEPWMYAAVIASTTATKNFYRLRIHPKTQIEFKIAATSMQESADQSRPVHSRVHLPLVGVLDIFDRVNREVLDFEYWKNILMKFSRTKLNAHDIELWWQNQLLKDLHQFFMIQSTELQSSRSKHPKPVALAMYKTITPLTWFFLFAMCAAKTARGSYLNHLEPHTIQADIRVFKDLMISEPEHASSSEHGAMTQDVFAHLNTAFRWPHANLEQLSGNFRPGIVQFRKLIEKAFDHD